MKAMWTGLGLAALWIAASLTAPAEEKPVATKAAPAVELRVKLHRTLADLIESRAAAKSDAAKVARLTTQVQELRKQIAATTVTATPCDLPPGCRACCPLAGGSGVGAVRGPGWRWANPDAAPGGGRGPGRGRGAGAGAGFAAQADPSSDMAVFHYLLDHHKEITRKVTKRPDGVETVTESNRPEVVAKIQEHAAAMHRRVKEGRPIHLRDPLFREIFANVEKIEMTVEKTPHGVRVRETSKDAYVARLIQAHADVVDKFVENGRSEMWKNHPLPDRR